MSHHKASLESVAEAVLFMFGREVDYVYLAKILDITDPEMRDVIASLQSSYEDRGSGLRILATDEHVQMVTHPDVADVIEQITKKEIEGPLTPVAMEVLSIIAYRGPIGKMDIEAIRGVNCSFTLRNLLRRGLIERVDVDDDKRTQHYQVSMDFLRSMGIESVEELPEFMELSTDKRIDAILYSEHTDGEVTD